MAAPATTPPRRLGRVHRLLHRHGVTRLDIKTDSLLLVEQMNGNYKVKSAGLNPLHANARLLGARLERVTYTHILRAQNKEADRLSNVGMDESQKGL